MNKWVKQEFAYFELFFQLRGSLLCAETVTERFESHDIKKLIYTRD